MRSFALRPAALRSAALLLAVTAAGSYAIAANASTPVPGTTRCAPHARSTAHESAAQVMRAIKADLPKACGFTMSGTLLGAAYGEDGVELAGQTRYDAAGNTHLVYFFQGIVVDVYLAAGSEYVRMYEEGKPTAAPDVILKTMWHAFGVSDKVINTAGSVKWVRLTTAERKAFNGPSRNPTAIGVLGSPVGFAAALVKGSGKAWTLGGTKTVNGVRCTVLTEGKNGLFPAESLYVRTTTGLPVMIRYAIPGGGKTTFASWGGTARVFAPSQVVAG